MDQAELYSQSSELQKADAEDAFREFEHLLQWKSGGTFADIGCGPGDVTVNLILPKLPSPKRVIGIDVSKNMISLARKKYGKCPEKLSFEVGDIGGDWKQFSSYEEKFDHVLSFLCLHFVLDQKKAFSNIHRMLKPNGDFMATLVVCCPTFDIYKKMGQSPVWSEYMKDVSIGISPYHNEKDILAKAKTNLECFASCKVYLRERKFLFKSRDEFIDFLDSINPWSSKLPPELKDEYMKEIFQQCVDLGIEVDGKYLFPYTTMIIYGKK